MEVPGSWESRGLTAFDGVVWFTRADRLAGRPARARRRCASGASATSARCGSTAPASPPPAVDPTAGRSPQVFEVPDGVLKAGANTITVRIQNLRGDGGFLGAPEALVVQSGEHKTSLAGAWRYRVERQTNGGRRSTAAPASWPRTSPSAGHAAAGRRRAGGRRRSPPRPTSCCASAS